MTKNADSDGRGAYVRMRDGSESKVDELLAVLRACTYRLGRAVDELSRGGGQQSFALLMKAQLQVFALAQTLDPGKDAASAELHRMYVLVLQALSHPSREKLQSCIELLTHVHDCVYQNRSAMVADERASSPRVGRTPSLSVRA